MNYLKLTDDMINKADEIIHIDSIENLQLKNIMKSIAIANLKHNGFYGYVDQNNKRILIIFDKPADYTGFEDLSTAIILQKIEALNHMQKTNPPTSKEWKHASKTLKPLFNEMAKRERKAS